MWKRKRVPSQDYVYTYLKIYCASYPMVISKYIYSDITGFYIYLYIYIYIYIYIYMEVYI
jgi:hypothetical protein